jgi:hypothetical protein
VREDVPLFIRDNGAPIEVEGAADAVRFSLRRERDEWWRIVASLNWLYAATS